jgi:hypothetical protein
MPYGQTTIAATATQLTTISGGSLTSITALATNTEAVWLGDNSSVTTSNGQPLYPGQNVALVGRAPSLNYLISASGSQKVGFNTQ